VRSNGRTVPNPRLAPLRLHVERECFYRIAPPSGPAGRQLLSTAFLGGVVSLSSTASSRAPRDWARPMTHRRRVDRFVCCCLSGWTVTRRRTYVLLCAREEESNEGFICPLFFVLYYQRDDYRFRLSKPTDQVTRHEPHMME
jgi:hypothetical protein